MHIIAVSRQNFGKRVELVTAMHRLRARVFKDRLDWDVSVSGDMEIDRYDALNPTHLIVVAGTHSEVIGCVRLLPTTGANMLESTFPMLLNGAPPPRDAHILESSRFCIDTERCAHLDNGLRQATFVLFAGMLEWGLRSHSTAIATVTDVRMERILRRAGWPLQRLGNPQTIGETQALAGLLPINLNFLQAIMSAGKLEGPIIVDGPVTLRVAA